MANRRPALQAYPKKPDPVPLTQAAYEKFQTEYRKLKHERYEVMERLKVARAMGDLSENGAYKYAKFELGNIGRRMRHLKFLLENGVVTESAGSGVIEFGSQVEIASTDTVLTFTMVSEYEADPSKKMLSTKSPIGKAALGKKLGDTFTVELPAGTVEYTVVSVQ